jgi:hypothetical protein
MAGDATQSSVRGTRVAANCQTRAVSSRDAPRVSSNVATNPKIPTAMASAGHIAPHTSRAAPETAPALCDAVCHSSRLRRVTKRRHSVRTIASADTTA